MRYFRRLPPLLRAFQLLALLTALASLGVLLSTVLVWCAFWFATWQVEFGLADTPPVVTPSTSWQVTFGLTLGLLSGACAWPVNLYVLRFRHPGRVVPWLDAWPTQLRAALALAALPLCALVVVLLVPPSASLFGVVFPLDILAALLLGSATIWTRGLSDGEDASGAWGRAAERAGEDEGDR